MNKKIVITSLIVLALISVAVILTINILNSNFDNSNIDETSETQHYEQFENTYDQYTHPKETPSATIPINEWGFNYMEEIGYGLVEITGFDLNKGYVYHNSDFGGHVIKFENGYYVRYKIDENNHMSVYDGGKQYNVINNDLLSVVGESGVFSIDERKTYGNNFVIFAETSGYESWYVPYSLIDWEKGISYYEPDNAEKHERCYKLYLK
ncbi:MAG: hypothetical protein E7555_09695 [Ruminococcaceae bacterium]|nr:hypothetical protein [Oscillospiraceae bacterium]